MPNMRSHHRMSSTIVIWCLSTGASQLELEMSTSLDGKRVVILGETSGIGPTPAKAVQLDRARGSPTSASGRAFGVKYGHPHIRPGGSVTWTNGVAGLRPDKGWTMAASICSAMESLNRALAMELAPIRVTVVRTELWMTCPHPLVKPRRCAKSGRWCPRARGSPTPMSV
jgi:hypothetical protein